MESSPDTTLDPAPDAEPVPTRTVYEVRSALTGAVVVRAEKRREAECECARLDSEAEAGEQLAHEEMAEERRRLERIGAGGEPGEAREAREELRRIASEEVPDPAVRHRGERMRHEVIEVEVSADA